MSDEALSGKTGFTGNAGYCYTCAVQSERRTFIISLLGCGWPPNKSWKWTDTQKLIAFAKENYEIKELGIENRAYEPVDVIGGVRAYGFVECGSKKISLLIGKHESFEISILMLTQIQAPVAAGQPAGIVTYCVDKEELYRWPIVFKENIEAKNLHWYFKRWWQYWMM